MILDWDDSSVKESTIMAANPIIASHLLHNIPSNAAAIDKTSKAILITHFFLFFIIFCFLDYLTSSMLRGRGFRFLNIDDIVITPISINEALLILLTKINHSILQNSPIRVPTTDTTDIIKKIVPFIALFLSVVWVKKLTSY